MDRDTLNSIVEHFRGLPNPTEKEKELLKEIETNELHRFPIAYISRGAIGCLADDWSDEEMSEFAGHMGDSYCDSSQYWHDVDYAKYHSENQ